MNPLHATVLGAVQGLTEVLPISSSAHLILIPWLFGWPESGITFDVALHLGTLIALALYFRRDIAELAVNALSGLTAKGGSSATRLPWYIIAGCVPAAIAGKTLEEPIEAIFRSNPAIIAALLIGFGLLLALADTLGSKKWRMDQIDLKSAMLIGLAQCLALLPGVSRSGITITAALFLGFSRETAARFSFLLSLPIVAGAALLKVGHLARHGIPEGELQPLLIGIGVSALFGYASVALLLKLVQRYSLYPFVWYRLLAGAGVLLFIFNQ
ncbi:undecaprenyl-diphosphatase UppP [Geobacter hydrogenophilus]|uniref:Undecaprenyl-diphosphatase n=1 Tax=Geobacter hydrogenophilus TaxID=40983 RepID=A0A9W6LCB0_9BACT|nr:undecaprenyl-diphosphatase UppP [Geobacter hydrogenophilus]MBT0893669.1 undecaprenyl-diphosphatase UppP [Geobacter hydrogenophilus]GLI37634.1 undecaprenyl-diphosphatase [Geobacter hydrogenophilus]